MLYSTTLPEASCDNVSTPRRAIVAKADRLYSDFLTNALTQAFPQVNVSHATSINDCRREFDNASADMLIVGMGFRDGDALELMTELLESRRVRKIMVVTTRRDVRLHLALKELRVDGVFNALDEGRDSLQHALQKVWHDGHYHSETFRGLLRSPDSDRINWFKQLSPKEQLVLSVIGDGSDDQEAANRLLMTAAAVRTHRKRLHAKLKISHKGQLMRLAIKHGFVRVTEDQIIRPGFAKLWEKASRSPFNPG